MGSQGFHYLPRGSAPRTSRVVEARIPDFHPHPSRNKALLPSGVFWRRLNGKLELWPLSSIVWSIIFSTIFSALLSFFSLSRTLITQMLHLLLCFCGSGTSFFTVSFLCLQWFYLQFLWLFFLLSPFMLLGPSSEFFVSHFFAETLPFFICLKPIYDSCCSIFVGVCQFAFSHSLWDPGSCYDAWFSVVSWTFWVLRD